LLSEPFYSDRLLKDYSFVLLDEVHERSVQTDVLFGVVKQAQEARARTNKRLKVRFDCSL
jgi:ATP-dependent RNA helicase DHX33